MEMVIPAPAPAPNLTSSLRNRRVAPIAIGLALTLFHLVANPVSNASLNPARSTATALFGGAAAWSSLWLFWVAPIIGGAITGSVYLIKALA